MKKKHQPRNLMAHGIFLEDLNETEETKQETKANEESNLIKALEEAIEEFMKGFKNA